MRDPGNTAACSNHFTAEEVSMKRNCNSLEQIGPADYSWSELCTKFLPTKMDQLLEAMKNPIPAADLIRHGAGLRALRKKHPQVSGECSGCYVLMENGSPVFTGISREVYRRVFRLLKEATFVHSTVANMLADAQVPMPGTCSYEKMKTPGYRAAHEQARAPAS